MKTLKKISPNIWEIPKQGRMNVPAMIFASDKLMNAIKQDKTLEQVQNVACLPGILKASLTMPDAHQGYGFSIGGVAAFDVDKGIISPGGVGYDINCLSKDSKILTELGYTKKIKEFENQKGELKILDKKNSKETNAGISLFMKKYSEKVIEVETESGMKISATEDHPFYTKKGMKEVKEIREGGEVLMSPFEGVEYKKPKKILLISEQDINNLNRSMTSKLQIKKKLKALGLLPLYSDNPKIPYLIKMMGFIFGDGSISIGEKAQIGFYGEKEDLELIKKDLYRIGFNSNLYSRKRNHRIKTQYKGYEFSRQETFLKNSSISFAILLKLLGTPTGNKAKKDYKVPSWIMDSVKWYKRLFLASLFGAELSSPKTMTNNRFNFYGLIYSLNKRNALHGINFVNQISVLLEEFDVRNVLIKFRKDTINGNESTRIRLMVYPDSKNLINFFSRINYEYNLKKRTLANAAIIWLKQKEKILEFREQILIKSREMKNHGVPKSKIIEELSSKYANKYFIDKAIYQNDYAQTGTRIAYCFISFKEFVEKNCYGNGFVWDKIISKKEKDYNDIVYDLTINNENHNFISNGFVVSNCSVRLLKTNLKKKDILSKQKEVVEALFRKIPSGVGRGSKFQITRKELDKLLKDGAKYMVDKGFGIKEDYLHTEEEGCLKGADPSKVSERAIKRGIGQVGTLGAGNHFLEVQYVEDIFDEEVAKVFGIEKDDVTIMVHCGSRGLGHQVASDYIKKMEEKYGFRDLPDRELINAPIKSQLGEDYFSAMACAANFAFANKQLITHWIREEMKYLFPKIKIDVVYDVCHNIAKFEKHEIDGEMKEVCVHRKGATRSFGPDREEVPERYKKIGLPVIIPGSMGTSSYLLVGTKKAEKMTWGSTAHGAGRVMSRHEALKKQGGEQVRSDLSKKGIEVKSGSVKGLAEEAPDAYKDIDEVIKVIDEVGLCKKVIQLRPLTVVKG